MTADPPPPPGGRRGGDLIGGEDCRPGKEGTLDPGKPWGGKESLSSSFLFVRWHEGLGLHTRRGEVEVLPSPYPRRKGVERAPN